MKQPSNLRIALYGKGGIGKSTMAANLAAALAGCGKRVLQIGCDPKHDSTRLLLDGRRIRTVLDYLRETPPDQRRLADVLHRGYGGVVCVEAGGPEPGVGCAGRGILSTFALLEQLGLDTASFDVVLYDVLGDVVCGGFAAPLRAGYAELVCIVTSEEFMALYAANNILRGVRNFEQAGTRVAGLILNSRGATESPEGLQRFAAATGLPLLATMARNERFRQAEQSGKTVVEAFPDSRLAADFRALAAALLDNPSLHMARPLSDEALEQIVLGKSWSGDWSGQSDSSTDNAVDQNEARCLPAAEPPLNQSSASSRFLSKSMLFREPLHGCAFSGAISTVTQIRDAAVIAHGPRSCAHIANQALQASGMHALQRAGIAIPEQLRPNLFSSEMDEAAVIYGGAEPLRTTLRQVLRHRPRAVFFAGTCPSAIIGDDLQQIAATMAAEVPGVPLIPLSTDGNLAGDYMQGMINACIETSAALIDPHCPPQDGLVNIVAEKNIATNSEANLAEISRLLGALDLRINCRFVRRTSVAALRGFCQAPLNLLADDDHLGRLLQGFLQERFGARFASRPFPVGLTATVEWLREVASLSGRLQQAEPLIEQAQAEYRQAIQRLRRDLAGRRLMIITYNHDVDWLLEVALDAGMEIVKVGILNSIADHGFRSRYAGRFSVATGYPPEQREADIAALKPQLLLTSYPPDGLALHVDSIPLCPDVGFFSGLRLARRWATLLKAPLQEGWRKDRALLADNQP